MSKILKTAAIVVGVTAAVIATAGAPAPAATAGFLGSVGITAGTAAATSALATTLSLVAGGLSLAGAVLTKWPGSGGGGTDYQQTGQPQQFTLDPNGPLPVIFGRLASAALVTFKRTNPHDDN